MEPTSGLGRFHERKQESKRRKAPDGAPFPSNGTLRVFAVLMEGSGSVSMTARSRRMDESSLKALKAEYVKQKADEALRRGNYRDAWTKYTECLELRLERVGREKVLSNRSMAFCKAHRYLEALRDAEECIEIAPRWEKSWWRLGQALFGMKEYDRAIDAYRSCLEIDPNNKEVEKAMWNATLHLTTEQIAEGIVRMIEKMQDEKLLKPPTLEEVTFAEKVEGTFRHIRNMCKDPGNQKRYHHKYRDWKGLGKWRPSLAYAERGAMYARAKCYLQARDDGLMAVKLLRKEKEKMDGGISTDEEIAYAYSVVGEGYAAEEDHQDRDLKEAAKAYTMAVDLVPGSELYKSKLQEYGRPLTDAQIAEMLREVYNVPNVDLPPTFVERNRLCKGEKERVFCMRASVIFSTVCTNSLTAKMRTGMISKLAESAGIPRGSVIIDGLKVLHDRGLQIHFVVNVQNDVVLGKTLKERMESDAALLLGLEEVLEGSDITVDQSTVEAELVDITPLEHQGQQESDEEDRKDGEVTERSVTFPSRPKLELEMPYKLYKLVTSDGRPVERKQKHPFQMSRVYYKDTEKPEETWAEICDGSCRWRQSSSEIKVIALKVPPLLSPKDLLVSFQTMYLQVKHRQTDEIYLEGQLERGIVPQDCMWTYMGGDGEDGLVIYLRKMNLELLQKYWEHSSSWWPRLFSHHCEIQWDDYEKDYSDLPEVVAVHHQKAEAIQEANREQERLESKKIESRKERNELRKRTRQERLNVLRSGIFKDWVQLDRENPHVDPLTSSRPMDVDKYGH